MDPALLKCEDLFVLDLVNETIFSLFVNFSLQFVQVTAVLFVTPL